MTEPNIDLMERTLAFIEQHQDRWNQGEFAVPLRDAESPLPPDLAADENLCWSALCFVGWAVILDGWSLTGQGDLFVRKGARSGSIADVGQDVPSVDDRTYRAIYDGTNDLDALRTIIRRCA